MVYSMYNNFLVDVTRYPCYDLELIVLHNGHYGIYVYLGAAHGIVLMMINRMNSMTLVAIRSIP